ncbi:hypothetical protein BGZ58_005503 [Dissophora ornata]|nr:hypothetical protein BGZ58_005503 [Dissophora ornata]
MSSQKDRKGNEPDVVLPEDERLTFGRQSPYATSSTPSHPEVEPVGSTAAPATSASPATRAPESHITDAPHPTMDAPPPAYEEVAVPRAPQLPYNSNPDNEEHNSNPSAPLLGRPPAVAYSAIPIQPARSTASMSSNSTNNPERTGLFNKSWLIVFAFVLLLLIINDSMVTGGMDRCGGRLRYTRNMTDINLSPDINDFTVTMSGLASYIIVDQATEEGLVPGTTKLIIEASSSDREVISVIKRDIKQDLTDGSLKATITGSPAAEDPECLRSTVRITFPPSMKTVQRLRLLIKEGNVTIDLLGAHQNVQVNELYTRVISGQSIVKADVPVEAYMGGSFGTMKGRIVVGQELRVNLVDGSVALDLAQKRQEDVTESRIEVKNGNIDVGLVTPYLGTFKLETLQGQVDVLHPDPARTHLSHVSSKSIRGWNSLTGKEPVGPTSELMLGTRNGKVALSMAYV